MNRAHTDLHPGNVLIIEATGDCDITALIHDFGRTIDVTDKLPITYIIGLLSFCGEFLGAVKRTDLIVPQTMKTAIEQIYGSLLELDNDSLSLESAIEIYKDALKTINQK